MMHQFAARVEQPALGDVSHVGSVDGYIPVIVEPLVGDGEMGE